LPELINKERKMYIPIEKHYPIWFSWRYSIDVPESTRKGIPRGQALKIGGRKYLAAASMILFPRGKKLQELAEMWGSSIGLITKWRTEDRFMQLIEKLEEEFAVYVLERMHQVDFLSNLENSLEPEHWSDRVLQIFTKNLGRAIVESTGKSDPFYLLKQELRSSDDWFTNLKLPQTPVHKVDLVPPPKDSAMMLSWQDLLSVGLQSLSSYPWNKRGPRPEKRKKKDIIAEKFLLIESYLSLINAKPNDAYGVKGCVNRAMTQLKDLKEMLNVK